MRLLRTVLRLLVLTIVFQPAVLPAARERHTSPAYAVIAAYQQAQGEPLQHGALALAQPPQAVVVDDANASSLPEPPGPWDERVLACFRLADGRTVRVPDLARLFAESAPDSTPAPVAETGPTTG